MWAPICKIIDLNKTEKEVEFRKMNHYNEYKSKDLARCKENLKMLYGIEPYNRPDNQLYRDGYFSVSIKQDFDEETIKQAKKELHVI